MPKVRVTRQFIAMPLDIARQVERLAAQRRQSFTSTVQQLTVEALAIHGLIVPPRAPKRNTSHTYNESVATTPEGLADVRLDSLRERPIPPEIIRSLRETGPAIIETIGELSAYITTRGALWGADFEGITDGGQTKITDAINAAVAAVETEPGAQVAGQVEPDQDPQARDDTDEEEDDHNSAGFTSEPKKDRGISFDSPEDEV